MPPVGSQKQVAICCRAAIFPAQELLSLPRKPMASRNRPAPLSSPIQATLDELLRHFRKDRRGEVATYIPELGKANPEWFGICVVTADGAVYEAGDTGQAFTIQSISKPFTYGIALEDNGTRAVLDKIWVEPTGEAFNSISLDPATGRPLNPMINAGAIATTGLVEGRTAAQKMNRLLEVFSRYTGRPMAIDRSVYQSESETGHRNRAIAHMLRNFNIFQEDPIPSLEAYFMQCSILVTCRDLGIMAATLANGGLNPVTGTRAVVAEYVENMLSVMGSCGMYDAAGEWIYNVGMPAKSGVAGGILAVLPGQLGIGVFSPRLDSHGNSVRGIEVCRELSRRFSLHMFHTTRPGRSVIRHTGTGGQTTSNRLRPEDEAALLHKHGGRIALLEIQGELLFSTAEIVIRRALQEAARAGYVILDFRHVPASDLVAAGLLRELASGLIRAGKHPVFSGTRHLPLLAKVCKKELPPADFERLTWIADLDLALEHCENQLIQAHTELRHSGHLATFAECDLVKGLKADEIRLLEALLENRSFRKGQDILRAGDSSMDVYFLIQGKASAWLDAGEGAAKRVATFTPGMVFGEMALLDQSRRSARVTADTDLECRLLPPAALKQVASEHPRIMMRLLHNLSKLLAARLRKANAELSALYQ